MEDYLLLELFKSKAKSDPGFGDRLYEYMKSGTEKHDIRKMRTRGYDSDYPPYVDKYRIASMEEPMDEHRAKHLVSKMYHYNDTGKLDSGEHFSLFKAASVCDAYKKSHHLDVTPEEVYVAINAQYHDYSKLFKTWFGSNIDNKIIDSAMCFWFSDADYEKGSKLMNYFDEM